MTCKDCSGPNDRRSIGGLPKLASALNGSSVLAYAWELGLPFVPFHINIRAVYEESSPATTQVLSFEGSNERLNVLKPQSDFFFQRQSGIQAQMIIAGAPRYVVAPYFTPLEGLMSTLAEGWPGGWVLEYTQSVTMQFTTTVPLPAFPTTITVTFRLWQPGSGQALDLVGMTNDVANAKLAQLRATGRAVRDSGLLLPSTGQ